MTDSGFRIFSSLNNIWKAFKMWDLFLLPWAEHSSRANNAMCIQVAYGDLNDPDNIGAGFAKRYLVIDAHDLLKECNFCPDPLFDDICHTSSRSFDSCEATLRHVVNASTPHYNHNVRVSQTWLYLAQWQCGFARAWTLLVVGSVCIPFHSTIVSHSKFLGHFRRRELQY